MHYLHKIADWIFTKYPSIKEFCFLSLPLAFCGDPAEDLYNAKTWHDYLSSHPNLLEQLPTGIDAKSKKNALTLATRRKSIRYFLHPAEILHYYQAKRLSIPYWFSNDGTLLKSVFFCKAGLAYIPHKYKSQLTNRIAIDGGAASGDSSIVLLECGARHVLAFEPSPLQREEMNAVFTHNNLSDKISIVPFAIGEQDGTISFNDQYGQVFDAKTTSIDNYCRNIDVGCIKLDIEGAEFPAIRGAIKTIERCHPILLICTYHRPEDLFEMPRWIQQHFPFYKFIFRDTEPGNRSVGLHLCLIAWPEDADTTSVS